MLIRTISALLLVGGTTTAWGGQYVAATIQVADALPGVPLAEELLPEKVEEYCQREPWILTPVVQAHRSAKFGFIPSRFLYLAQQAEKAGNSEGANLYKEAARQASRLYHRQLQESFQFLISQMNRHEIGAYAQELWINVTSVVEQRHASLARFIGGEKLKQMDDELIDLARDRIYMNTKWLALNINELPTSARYGF